MATEERLERIIRSAMHATGVPGVALGISYDGKTMSTGFGISNVNQPVPVTDETLFHIGSITKTYTSMAIMRLVDGNLLNLDDTVRTYIPEFKVADAAASNHATVRHLLTHAGGWEGDFFHLTGREDDALTKYVAEMTALEQLAPVGTIWSYCNSGFDVAGSIIERVTGISYEAAVQKSVLEPLELKSTFFAAKDPLPQEVATGHCLTESGAAAVPHWPWPRHACPSGGIVCSVKDLLQFGHFHLGKASTPAGNKLLAPDSFVLMHSPQLSIWTDDEAMGLGWFVDRAGGTRHLWSAGVTIGQNSFIRLIPQYQFAMVILTNANTGGSLITEIDQWAMQHYLGIETLTPSLLEITKDDAAPYLGHYSRPFAHVELVMEDGKLLGRLDYKRGLLPGSPPLPSPPPIPFAFCEKDRLLVLDGPFKGNKAEFIRTPDGEIGWLRVNRRLHRRLQC